MNKTLSLQLLRFGIVGVCAAALHYCVVVLLVQNDIAPPLLANIVGFCGGFQISYWGHRSWTFEAIHTNHRRAMPRMMLLQSLNFIANEGLFYVLLSLAIPYPIALFIVLSVLPIFTFIASKSWVFD